METKSQMINRIAELSQENAELKGTIDAYQISENEANEIIAELKAENERLKEENKLIRQLHKDLSDKLFEFQKIEDALQEIKAIAEETIDIYYPDYYDEGFEEDIVTEFAKQVLDLITKAESEG